MDLNSLLNEVSIDPSTTLVLRHRPQEPQLRRVLPWLAAERPAVYNAYQQTQSPKAEKQMLRSTYVASFIGDRAGRAFFVGLYENKGQRIKTSKQLKRWKPYAQLVDYGMKHGSHDSIWFDLMRTKHFADWRGKLIIRWPPPEISWSRWSAKNKFDVIAILEESLLTPAMPDWRELIFTWSDLAVIPKSWKAALSEWRGIYFIYDVTDGKGYVGSAYGKFNIRGRWEGYAKSGHGGNKLLKKRRPENLRFSILERMSPDTPAELVIERESSWKERLHTRESGLNEN